MMAVIGGTGTLFGPMLGAGIVLYLQNVLSATIPQWLLVQGLIFMAFVVFLPGGVVEAGRRLARALSRGRKRQPPVPDAASVKGVGSVHAD
jgi:branched-chain amino acid transport system permease protein